ncbi:hypothetical protein ACFQ0G_53735 [Streptomyces chiangmaiensis]
MTATVAPKQTYPRPQLVHDHTRMFVEPTYQDGQPYAEDDELEDESDS